MTNGEKHSSRDWNDVRLPCGCYARFDTSQENNYTAIEFDLCKEHIGAGRGKQKDRLRYELFKSAGRIVDLDDKE